MHVIYQINIHIFNNGKAFREFNLKSNLASMVLLERSEVIQGMRL